MPFQLSNTFSQNTNQTKLSANLVTFLEWQKFEHIAVGEAFPVITNEFAQVIQYFQWGLVPVWAKSPVIGRNMGKTKLANLHEKAALQAIFEYKRCVVPVSYFSVWANKEKTALLEKTALNDEPLMLAGIWSLWSEGLYTFSVLTSEYEVKGQKVDWPFILSKSQKSTWLQKSTFSIKTLDNFLGVS